MKTYHSRSYHAYFEGYTEKETGDGMGGDRIIRIYTGDYYVPELTAKERRNKRCMYLCFYLASLCLFVFAGCQRIIMNQIFLVAGLEAVSFFMLFLLLRPLAFALVPKDRYTVYEYAYASEKFKRYTLTAALCFLFAALAMGIYEIWYAAAGWDRWTLEVSSCILALLLGSVLLSSMHQLETKTIYHRQASEEIRPTDGVDIRF